MCGICGIVDLRGHDRADVNMVQTMCDIIRHRGPDGDGFYQASNVALGMRRLSIIDVKGSDQPLYNEDRSIALVFNGEIYNYRELRRQLATRGHVLHTDGDGETIIHLYEEYGLNLFSHLRGMYAFALWDVHQQRLVLAVDHIGMKPLYLHERDGKLLFASEAKALFADPDTPSAMNLEVVDTFLSFGYMIGAETLFEGVHRLPPGHALIAENGETRLHQHWEFPAPSPSQWGGKGRGEPSEGIIISEARDLIADSVRIHLRSDVPLGLFLSGGVDSAAMLALMSKEAGGRVKTFTVGYAAETSDNELLHARRIAEHFKTEHHERVITADDWWREFERYVYHHDEPNANPSAVSLQLLSEDTAKQVKVVLTGLGGDELFGGYPSHHNIPRLLQDSKRWGGALKLFSKPLADAENLYPAFKRYRYVGALPTYLPRFRHATLPRDEALMRMISFDGMVFSDALRERLYSADLLTAWQTSQHKERTFSAIIERSWRDNPYNTAQALVINTWLTGNALLSQDKTAMSYSLEARVPFFDPELLKFAANVPPEIRMKSNKYVLREAMRPLLPEFALDRPKQAFSTPILGWFENELVDNIRQVLLDPNGLSRDLFNRGELERLLLAHFDGRERSTEVIFRLLNLELWTRRFLKGETVDHQSRLIAH
jgi:asparagine synthase (glutamine-hydrolysing)